MKATGCCESTMHFRLTKVYGLRPWKVDVKLDGHHTNFYDVQELLAAMDLRERGETV